MKSSCYTVKCKNKIIFKDASFTEYLQWCNDNRGKYNIVKKNSQPSGYLIHVIISIDWLNKGDKNEK